MSAMRLLVFFICLPGLWLGGCGGELPPPEMQIRARIGEAREAAEARDLSRLRRFIADDYRDAQARDKADVVNLLRLLFLRHQSVHLLVRVQEIDLPEPGTAVAVVYVAMAGRPFPEQDIGLLQADLHRFDLRLKDLGGGDWQAVEIAWRRPDPGDWLF